MVAGPPVGSEAFLRLLGKGGFEDLEVGSL
jgi:hypothetical protein